MIYCKTEETGKEAVALSGFLDGLRDFSFGTMTIVRLKIHTLEDGNQAQYAVEVQLRGGVNSGDMTERVERMPGIVSVVTL